jgi:hypothetical protein
MEYWSPRISLSWSVYRSIKHTLWSHKQTEPSHQEKKKSHNCKIQALYTQTKPRVFLHMCWIQTQSKHWIKCNVSPAPSCPSVLQLLIASLTGTITVEGIGFGIWYSGQLPLGWMESQPPKSSSPGSYQSRKVPQEMRDKPGSGMLTTVQVTTPESTVSKTVRPLSLGPKPTFLQLKTSNDFNASSMHVRPAG